MPSDADNSYHGVGQDSTNYRIRLEVFKLHGVRPANLMLAEARSAAILERVGCPQLPPTGNVPNTSMP
jgi:hypothetical protein